MFDHSPGIRIMSRVALGGRLHRHRRPITQLVELDVALTQREQRVIFAHAKRCLRDEL